MKFRIRERREELGLTMTQLAEAAGVSEATVSRWESGDVSNMRKDNITNLAKALRVSPAYILGWDKDDEVQVPAYFATPDMMRIAKAVYENTTLRFLVDYALDLPMDDLLHITEIVKSLSGAKK